jgi:co-chaperonin GroES (HSP10)
MGDSQTILIPEQFKDRHYKPEGVILAVGPGYYGKDGIFREVSKDLKPGVKVTFDMNVPWRQNVEAADGKLYTVVMCTELDISCIVEEK